MALRVTVLFAAILAVAAMPPLAGRLSADHDDNGHSGYIINWDDPDITNDCGLIPLCEMNARTTTESAIKIRVPNCVTPCNVLWLQQYAAAITAWNSGMASYTDADAFQDVTSSQTVTVQVVYSYPSCSSASHGCVRQWDATVPTAIVSMDADAFPAGQHDPGLHKKSDLMHELGHVLMNAGDHYPNYNCSAIMGHSYEDPGPAGQCGTGAGSDIIKSVQAHDINDYLAAYGIEDAPNAAYLSMYGSSTLVHWFEGGYEGGNGVTVHAEKYNRLEVSTTGLGGTYVISQNGPRKVDNQEDANPENDQYTDRPALNQEWCFRRLGRAGGIDSTEDGYYGPPSKQYCVAREGPGVGAFFTSDRNGYAHFRVWNFTGATMTNVQLRTNDSGGGIGDLICSWSSIANNASSATCSVDLPGPGFLDIWYCCTLVDEGNLGYDE